MYQQFPPEPCRRELTGKVGSPPESDKQSAHRIPRFNIPDRPIAPPVGRRTLTRVPFPLVSIRLTHRSNHRVINILSTECEFEVDILQKGHENRADASSFIHGNIHTVVHNIHNTFGRCAQKNPPSGGSNSCQGIKEDDFSYRHVAGTLRKIAFPFLICFQEKTAAMRFQSARD